MPVTCPTCHVEIPVEDVNLESRLGKCRQCNEVFELEIGSAISKSARKKSLPARPKGIELGNDPGQLKLTYSWYEPVAWFMLFFCIGWDSFLIFWYWITATQSFGSGGFVIFAWIFPIGHLAIGIGLTYWTIGAFFNRTVITLTVSRLAIWHGPILWRGSRTLDPATVTRVRTKRSGDNDGQTRYALEIETDDGKSFQVLSWIEKSNAYYLRDWLKQELALS